MKPNQIICGSNIDVVKPWPANCIDGIVTDAPYELGFMGKGWDSSGIAYNVKMWKQMLRITKPGGFLLCFGGTRTYHRLACAIEDAGWEIRDCMMWLYGSGFPKSHNISKAIDKKTTVVCPECHGTGKTQNLDATGYEDYWLDDPCSKCGGAGKVVGAKREVVGTKHGLPGYSLTNGLPGGVAMEGNVDGSLRNGLAECNITAPATDLAQLWDGYGTALKPAWEPIIVAMKPLDGTFAHNAEKHGVAGLNIDGGRIEGNKVSVPQPAFNSPTGQIYGFKSGEGRIGEMSDNSQGRWPANLVLDEEVGAMLDEQTGELKSGKLVGKYKGASGKTACYGEYGFAEKDYKPTSGGASRFFYCAKTSRKERNMGLEDMPEKRTTDGCIRANPETARKYQANSALRKNIHPTVKPLALMKYLCTLLKMPSADQIILDPFLGSGTTGMACKELGINFIGIEKEQEYCEISVKRIAAIEGIHPFVLHTDNLSAEVPKPNPPNDEHRQRIIDAASAALRKKTL